MAAGRVLSVQTTRPLALGRLVSFLGEEHRAVSLGCTLNKVVKQRDFVGPMAIGGIVVNVGNTGLRLRSALFPL
jgi:hypothetical protein